MEPITAPIGRTDRGSAVQNLQDGILLLLAAVDRLAARDRVEGERRDGVYGDVTTEMVGRFQRDHPCIECGIQQLDPFVATPLRSVEPIEHAGTPDQYAGHGDHHDHNDDSRTELDRVERAPAVWILVRLHPRGPDRAPRP